MKRIGIAILLLSTLCYAQSTDGFAPASTNVWGAEYPRIDATGKVEFRVKAPNATKVQINFWGNPKLDMVKQPDGFWTVTTPPLVPGFHYYTVVVDGTDFSDPSSQLSSAEARTRAALKSRNTDRPTICRRMFPTAPFERSGISPSVTGDWRHALVYTAAGLRHAGEDALSRPLSAARRPAKMRPAGSGRATPISSSTT